MVPNCFRNMICVVAGLVCAVSYGEELPDLVARLQKLDGKDAIHAVVHIEDRISSTEEKGSQQLEKADLIIAADANALTLTVTGKIPNTRVFRDFSLLRANDIVNCGPALARELAGLELVERLPDLHEGVSCTRWRLKSEEKKSKLGASETRRRDVELWIGPNGWPLRASFKTQTKRSILFIKVSTESKCEQRYERLRGRLIPVFEKLETEQKSKAGRGKRIVTITLKVKKD